MINTRNNGTPFILKRIQIKQNTFMNDYFQCDIIPFPENGPPASSVSFKMNSALKAAIGEHLERTSVYVNNKRFKNLTLTAYNMITWEPVLLPLHRILLNWSVPIFKQVDLINTFNDTCGLACHTTSFNCVQSAFFEFFERQCLLYNWFTSSPGKQLYLKHLLKDGDLRKLIKMAYHHVEELYFFDISIHCDVKVIISIALGEKTKGVGLCAHWGYKDAILGSIKELFQYITIEQFDNTLNGKQIDNNLTDPLYYSKHFMNHVNSCTLKKDFDYLISNSEYTNINASQSLSVSKEEFNTIAKKISSEVNMDLILCYIPQLYQGINTKIVKILTTKGFYHMFAAEIDPHKVPILEAYDGELQNIGKMIPFG
ncbi:YcaO-like family protein [Paenibacillus profundus]|uniref:YcaO-like family protein n=1 Tax=Paenibacillus profundus TaxID=1173085 RepID=A0ABS8YAC1_9BACL|nr:YcaO-like family protein [Paenibacillus profundus]MCE5168302.1 YcaO-like family protein [Paenibacillus profundus]